MLAVSRSRRWLWCGLLVALVSSLQATLFDLDPIAEASRAVDSAGGRGGQSLLRVRGKRRVSRRERARARRRAMRRPLDRYPLDGIRRRVRNHRRLPCARQRGLRLVAYRGHLIRYSKPVYVPRAFRERLMRFEELLVQTARDHYGRAPVRLRHMGTFNCRTINGDGDTLSEHALGNGIDVSGFDFAPLGRRRRGIDGIDGRLRRGFRVNVETHWDRRRGVADAHSRFLRDLAARLMDRPDIFRVLLGPAFPGHDDHFHFDCAPRREVAIFGRDR